MTDHGAASPTSTRQFAEFAGKVLRSLPEMDSTTTQRWIENEQRLKDVLAGALLSEYEHQIFTLEVNYDQSAEEALGAGNYDSVNENLAGEHFPSTRGGIEQVVVHLIHFGRQMTSEEVLEELDKQGLRSATIEELLALGADPHTKDLQRQFPTVALGSVLTYPSGHRYAPALWGGDRDRCASLHWFDSGWFSGYRFAAVSK